MESLYCPLKLPVTFFKEKFNKKKYMKTRHFLFDRDEISEEFYDFLNNLGLKLNHAEVFFSLPNRYYTIHKDQHDKNDFPKINFVFDGKGSFMNWYKVKSSIAGTTSSTEIGAPFIGYNQDEVDLLFQTNLHETSLVQAGVPHNVTSPSIRWCVSTVYTKLNNQLLTWQEATNIFKPYNLQA